jgi:hypothetical protein
MNSLMKRKQRDYISPSTLVLNFIVRFEPMNAGLLLLNSPISAISEARGRL